MKNLILAVLILVVSSVGALAQADPNTGPLSQLKSDYNQVGIVAHVKITSIKFAAEDVHPLYVVQSEIIEPFKGKIKRGQRLEFYVHVEEGYDVNRIPGEWVVFLEGKYPIPPGGKGWYELENSSRPASKATLAMMRKVRNTRKRY
ncbi:MAG: hypothetical protein QOJ64_1839 [Acidobacteriota bacterium]|jgi:hypothetical protein|nr:hypothetical protein [Acidobacteriota bacterium]